MKSTKWVFWGLSIILAFGLILTPGCTKKETEEAVETVEQTEPAAAQETDEPGLEEPVIELPAAVSSAVKENFPDAEIYFIEQAEQFGIVLYDIEFKADKGEIEVAEDGTVIDLVTIISLEQLPAAAAQAIQAASEGVTIKRLEKSEIRSEIKQQGEQGVIVKLNPPKYIYEAELEKDGQTGEITVDAAGNIIEPLKWDSN